MTDADLQKIADELGEPIEIVREMSDAIKCCADEGPMEAHAERWQRAREAGLDAADAQGAPLADEADRLDVAIETALRVRVDAEVCEAACEVAGIGPGNRDRMKPIIEAAFRAAGFEVEQ